MNNNIVYIALGIILVFFVAGKLGGGKKASPAAILQKVKDGAGIIDVRTPGEFSGGSYPKARNIPLDSLRSRLGDLGSMEKPIVVYCASGARSAQAARILKRAGYTDVTDAGALSGMPR